MKKATAILALLFPLLLSCGSSPDKGDGTKIVVRRNGDLAAVSVDEASIEDVSRSIEVSGIQKKVERDEPFFLLLSREGCSHCKAMEPYYVRFVKNTGIEAYDLNGTYANAKALCDYASAFSEGNFASTFLIDKMGTPMFFFIDPRGGEAPHANQITPNVSSTSAITKSLLAGCTISEVTSIQTYTGFLDYESHEEDFLLFVDDGSDAAYSFYKANMKESAPSSKKKTAWLEIDRLSEEEQAEFKRAFGTEESSFLVERKNGVYGTPLAISSEAAASLASSYYA